MKLALLLALLSVSGGSGLRVTSVSGQDVTLTCKYDIKKRGALSMCWGRGDIPSSGCNNQLIASDGRQVTFGGGASSRYRFLGRLQDGDVSLTVLNVLETDAGRYGCRVEIPGWLNDAKHHIDLSVQRAPQMIRATPLNTTTEQTHTHTAADQMFSTQILQTSSLSPEVRNILRDAGGQTVFRMCLVFGVLAVLTAVIIVASRRRRLSKDSDPQVYSQYSQVWFRRGSPERNHT
ncbi:T-cell immunoglobulin and mucin domain-containing protein 4-like [Trematomus bernacchii]|uniref:T-cell immunoglobulin and mucin domain-containing protein 4-like n=1 Tax=Trematomus bernacchii TaxID=40690 RepID=UPI00146B47FC|nr:T-cell immunoglobulin and mucin domain-containing protein 4-like [Trematomus bernacchii]